MRRLLATMILLAAMVPTLARAQVENCFDCLLGIWDDPAMTTNLGAIVPGEPKDIYVGVKLSDRFSDLSGLEFSVYGLNDRRVQLLGAVPLGPRALVWGTVPAPADTSILSTGDGGISVGWSECRSGDQALIKLTIYTREPVSDEVLQIKRSYPTSSPEWATPIVVRCDRPTYTQERVTGGCYVLNWTGTIDIPCLNPYAPVVSVAPSTWTEVKQLFR